MMPFLSVVIPVYNAERYLKMCFDSIKKQSFPDYEVIIVDDGSQDNSPEICDEYARIDERVKVYHMKNGGASLARNIGFSKATGEYIYCIDNDDFIEADDYFDKIHTSLINNPVNILQTGATYSIDETGKVNRKVNYINAPKIDVGKPYDTIYWLIANKVYETSCWTKVINRNFLITNKYFFDTNLVVEDLDWNMRFLQNIETYNLFQSSDYIHVYRSGSITSGKGEKGYKICLDQVQTIRKWANYYTKCECSSKLKDAALSYLAYQFFITIGKASTLEKKWKKQIKKPLKDIAYVAKYSIERKQKILSFVYHLCGFELTSKILNVYYTKMRTRVR